MRRALIRKSQRQLRWDFLFEAAGPSCSFEIKNNLVLVIQNFIKNCWDDVRQVGQGQHGWLIHAFLRANGYR